MDANLQDPRHVASRRKAVAPISLELGSSARLRVLYTLILVFVTSVLLLLALLYSPWILLLSGLLVPIAWRHYRLHLSESFAGTVLGLQRSSDGCWSIVLRSGSVLKAHLLNDSIVLPVIMILYFRDEQDGRRRAVVILPDSIGSELYRRTCVSLLASRAGQ